MMATSSQGDLQSIDKLLAPQQTSNGARMNRTERKVLPKQAQQQTNPASTFGVGVSPPPPPSSTDPRSQHFSGWKSWVSRYPWLGVAGGATIGVAGLAGSIYAIHRLRLAIQNALVFMSEEGDANPNEIQVLVNTLQQNPIPIPIPPTQTSPELIDATRTTINEALGEWYDKLKGTAAAVPLSGGDAAAVIQGQVIPSVLSPAALGALAGGVTGAGVLLAGNLFKREDTYSRRRRHHHYDSSLTYPEHHHRRQQQQQHSFSNNVELFPRHGRHNRSSLVNNRRMKSNRHKIDETALNGVVESRHKRYSTSSQHITTNSLLNKQSFLNKTKKTRRSGGGSAPQPKPKSR